MLPAFLPSCSEPGLRGPEPPLLLESVNNDRAQGWTPDLGRAHGLVLTAEWVLQVGMGSSRAHPHGPGMDVAAGEQQTAQPSPAGWNISMGSVLLFPWVITGTKQQFQEYGRKRGLRENLKAEEIWRKWTAKPEMNRVGLRERKPRSSSHFKDIQRVESFRAAAGGALGGSAQAHYFLGRMGEFLTQKGNKGDHRWQHEPS